MMAREAGWPEEAGPVECGSLNIERLVHLAQQFERDQLRAGGVAAYGVWEQDGTIGGWDCLESWPEDAQARINEAIDEWKEQGEEPPTYTAVKLYTIPETLE